MKQPKNEAEARLQIDRTLSKLGKVKLTDGEFWLLVERDFISDFINSDDESLEYVVEFIMKVREHSERDGNVAQPRTSKPPQLLEPSELRLPRRLSKFELRARVLGALLAQDANKRPEVIKFRSKYLSQKLLSPDQVEDWIRRNSKADGETTLWVTLPMTQSEYEQFRSGGCPPLGDKSYGWVAKFLSYAVPGSSWEHKIGIAVGGTLDKLRQLSEMLTLRYAWDRAQATQFVLTGQIPVLEPIRARSELKSRFDVSGRITLTLDPALSADEVAAYYRKIRRRKYNGPGEKHMTMALFAATVEGCKTWKDKLIKWNDLYGDRKGWAYLPVDEAWRNFRNHCIRAQERLLAAATDL
jgi:hypothetical protein